MILVTGATGFVGRRLIRKLVQHFDRKEILCLAYDQSDNDLERSGRAVLDELGVAYIPIDLVSGRGMHLVPKSPRLVFHLASNTTTGDRNHSINDVGAKNLIDAIRPLARSFHFVFTSTISVSDHRVHGNLPCDETSELLRPFSEYGRKKLLTEKYLSEVSAKEGMTLSILRLSGIYGKTPKPGGLFDSLAELVKRNSILSRFNYPGRISVAYVDDVADALIELAKTPLPEGRTELNIFATESPSVSEMSEMIHRAQGKEYKSIRLPEAFWSLSRIFSRAFYAIEPIVPHYLYNRIWQITLLMNNGYDNRPKRLATRLKNPRFTQMAEKTAEFSG